MDPHVLELVMLVLVALANLIAAVLQKRVDQRTKILETKLDEVSRIAGRSNTRL